MTIQTESHLKAGTSAAIAAVVIVVIALATLIAAPSMSSVWGEATDPTISAAADAAPSTSATPTGDVTRATVTVTGMSFSPSQVDVPLGNDLELTIINDGTVSHDIVFESGAASSLLTPGTSETIEVGPILYDQEAWCSVPGHRQMGMRLMVNATGSESPVSAPSTTSPERLSVAATSASVPMDALLDSAASTDPYPAVLPPLMEETTRRYTFEVTETNEVLAQGTTRELWTFNGTSPGPVLHGRVGDKFIVTLENNGTMGHSIDFHAGDVSPDLPMRTIEPGESLVYEFTAHRSGIWMYHCSTMPMSLHIGNGMFGAVIIEPDDLPEVDQSYVLIQSEVYVAAPLSTEVANEGDAPTVDGHHSSAGPVENGTGTRAAHTGAAQVDGSADTLMAFNGRPFQYDAHPLTVQTGDRVRMWILDVGPDAALSFHVVGAQFDTVWTEGAYSLVRGQAANEGTEGETGAQVLPLLAAQGGFIEFVPREAGRYTFVNHIMTLAERGAHGTLVVHD